MCACICTNVHMCDMSVYVCMHMYVHVCVNVHMCAYMCMFVHMCVHGS